MTPKLATTTVPNDEPTRRCHDFISVFLCHGRRTLGGGPPSSAMIAQCYGGGNEVERW
jgi:hypothetical protein